MAKSIANEVLDAALQVIADSTQISICEGEPLTYEEANLLKGSGGKALAKGVVSGGDFLITDGDANGRKVTVSEQNGLTIDVDGTADHVALTNVTGTQLNVVTTAPAQGLSTGGTADIDSWDVEISDPV